MKTIFLFVIAALLILGCTQYGAQSQPAATAPTQSVPAAAQNNPSQNQVSISIQNYAFSPASINISAGTTVTWTNLDSVPHSATADDSSFDTSTFGNGAQKSITFSKPGTYTYHCTVHPMMKGVIIVS